MGPPYEPRRRRDWRTYDRPYTGCGCLYAILILLLIWWILSFLLAPARGWW